MTIRCPRDRSDMTPCVARDGALACADNGVCVGCGDHPANLLKDLVLDFVDAAGGRALHAQNDYRNE